MSKQKAMQEIDLLIEQATNARNALNFDNAREALRSLSAAVQTCTQATRAIHTWKPEVQIVDKTKK